MQEEHLTVDQCDELAKALREDAARLPQGSERENLLQLAEGYRVLADMKGMVLRKVKPMMSVVGTNAKCQPRRAMSEFGGEAETSVREEYFAF
jgi:hypothetical protein